MRELDATFDRIEQTVLPTIAAMLDAVIDSAAGARPGIDAEAYAAALRRLAAEVEAAHTVFSDISADAAAGTRPGRPKPPGRLSSAA